MGFVSESNSILLTAFYTQKGRAYYLNGQDKDKRILYFSLGDSDTNYITASNTNISTDEANVLDSGFVPDLSGNYSDCIKTVADGTPTSSFLIYQPTGITNTAKEIRFFDPLNNNYDGKNELDIKVDLGKYMAWLKKFSQYSTNNSDPYNKNQPDLTSPFVKFYEYIGIFDSINNTIDTNINTHINLSEGDYKVFEQLNRFLIDYTMPYNFKVTNPTSSKQGSPLNFLFTTTKGTTNAGQGQGGIMINNRNYGYYLLNKTTNETTYYPYTGITDTLTLTQGDAYEYRPYVGIRYYNSGVINEEVFKLRTDYSIFSDANNEYLKLFVNADNKTLAYREAELLEQFIKNRTDLFYMTNDNKYYSKPLTLFIKASDINNVLVGSLKISLYWDTNITHDPLPNDTFLI